MSIEERAIAWSEQHRDIYMCNADVIAEVSYSQGARDQFDIDVVNAYDIYVEACRNGGYTYSQFKQRLIEHGKEC